MFPDIASQKLSKRFYISDGEYNGSYETGCIIIASLPIYSFFEISNSILFTASLSYIVHSVSVSFVSYWAIDDNEVDESTGDPLLLILITVISLEQ